MKKKKIVSIIVLVLLLLWVGNYARNNWPEFAKLSTASWSDLLLLVIAALSYLITQGLIGKAVVLPFGIHLRFREWFGILVVTLMGNYIFPFAGIGFRASYLKRVHDFKYSDFMVTLSAIYVMEFFIYSFLGLVGLGFIKFAYGAHNHVLTIVFALGFIGFASILFFSPTIPHFNISIIHKASDLLDRWYRLKSDRSFVVKILILTVLEFLTYALMFFFAFRALNLSVGFISTFVVACLSDYSFFIRLAPASLGTYEASVIYSSLLYGLTIAEALMVVALIRVSTMLWFFTLGPIFSYLLLNEPRSNKCPDIVSEQEPDNANTRSFKESVKN